MQQPLDVASVAAALEDHNAEQHLDSELAASLSNSISSLHRVDHEALIIGASVNGRMAVVRRNFCLFVLFDLLVVSFIWLILQMLTGDGDPMKIFNHEIVHYSIKTSLFDLVMAAACRFTILILFYAVLHLNTKLFVALTTAGTCAFLIVKVIYFNWKESNEAAIQGISFLVSFSLSWGEVWFLDMRVMPIEEQARESLARNDMSKRIVSEYMDNLAQRIRLKNDRRQPDEAGFFTPFNDDDDEEDEVQPLPTPQEALWLREAGVAEEFIRALLLENIQWTKSHGDNIAISWTKNPKYYDYCRIEAVMDYPAEMVLSEIFDCAEDSPRWNDSLQQFSRLHVINPKADVCHQVTKSVLRSTPREMVFVRSRVTLPKGEAIIFVSVEHPRFPPSHGHTRAHFAPSCWIVEKNPKNPLSCVLHGYINVDMKTSLMTLWFRPLAGTAYRESMEKLRERLYFKGILA